MATHSSVLAWRIPGTGQPGGLPSMGSHRVGHDWSDIAAAAVTTSDIEHLFMCLLASCIASLKKYLFKSFALFLLQSHLACGILVSWPGIEPMSLQWSLNHWTAREVSADFLIGLFVFLLLSYKSSLFYILDLYQLYDLQIFFSISVVFWFSRLNPLMHKHFEFWWSPIYLFLLLFLVLDPRPQRFAAMFSSKSFMV